MRYEIKNKEVVIGTTEFEGGDPPMGLVYGRLFPTQKYIKVNGEIEGKLYNLDSDIEIKCDSIYLEDQSEEMKELWVEVTATIESPEEYDKHFMHHREAYTKQFKNSSKQIKDSGIQYDSFIKAILPGLVIFLVGILITPVLWLIGFVPTMLGAFLIVFGTVIRDEFSTRLKTSVAIGMLLILISYFNFINFF